MVKIIADSCCDLSPELVEKYSVDIVPMEVLIEDHNYQDGVNMTTPELFHQVEQKHILPKTAAPPISTIMDHFSRYEDIVYFTISSKLSASYQNALLARENLQRNDIRIIDSLNLSTGIGLLVLAAVEFSRQGLDGAQIEGKIRQLLPHVYSSFTIDTLEYVYKGGRCSGVELLVGSVLKIRPVIEVKANGTLGVKKKINGSRKKSLNAMVEDFTAALDRIDTHRVFITHTLVDGTQDAQYLQEELVKVAKIDEILITQAGSTIASHCGPSTIGILYLTK